MKERGLSAKLNKDETIVSDPDGKMAKSLKKIYSELTMNLGFCCEQLENGRLTEGMKQTHLSLSENYLIEFLKAVDYSSILEKEKQQRYTEIRSLNEENRALRTQLGEKVSNEDVRERLKIMESDFNKWWSIYGFGHVSGFSFGSYCAKIKLSGMVFESHYKKEVNTDERKCDYLNRLGFEIQDQFVVMSEKSLKLFESLIIDKYPSADIVQIETYMRDGVLTFKEIDIHIPNLDEL